jgi:Uma2 family endonuclease
VLSDSTESYARGPKFDHYKQVPSLREYLLVPQREPLIELFRRGERDEWNRLEARASGTVRLEAIGCALSVDRVYAGIDL